MIVGNGGAKNQNLTNTTPLKKTKNSATNSDQRALNSDSMHENLVLDNYLSYTKPIVDKTLTRNGSYENFVDYTILHGIIGVSNEVSDGDKEQIIYEFERRKEILSSSKQTNFIFYNKKTNSATSHQNPKTKILLNTKKEIDLH